jgi:tetratricopeptide (TPR) repeat protein
MTCKVVSMAEACLGVIAAGVHHLKQGDHAARRAFSVVLQPTINAMPPAEGSGLRALALYNVSRLHLLQGRTKESRQMREEAAGLLTTNANVMKAEPFLRPLFNVLMADVLTALGEYRRALPFCEASVQNMADLDDPVATAEELWRAGRCYARIGLRDHAAVHLHQAMKIFRTLAGDPRLQAVLLDRGNALRKSNPAEAERSYQEAADLHVSRAQLESATPAWVNLGVLCSEQGRYEESLAHYGKALRVREQSNAPPERMGVLLNNIANTQRRMGKFEEALQSVDRAIEFLKPQGGRSLASAYGTRGLIFRDQGRDEDAVEWFRRSSTEHQKLPSPNLEKLCEELENEAAALTRLGKLGEAKHVQERLESVRASRAEIGIVDLELGDLKPPSEGAVLIELDFGSGPGAVHGKNDSSRLGRRLADVLEDQGIGYYGGHVVIPETTTLMFYGSDAEAIFGAMRPLLLQEPMCGGATVTVRQAGKHREVFLPGRMM